MTGTALRVAMASVVLAAGCTPFATYPTPEGSARLGGPLTEPMPQAMATAIRFEHDWHGHGATPIINLPPGTPAAAYDEVIRLLGEGQPMTDSSQRAYTIECVRVRPFTAEVDLSYPAFRGGYESATVSMKRHSPSGRYQVTGTRQWRLRLEPPRPNYVPPPPKAGRGTSAAQAAPELERDLESVRIRSADE